MKKRSILGIIISIIMSIILIPVIYVFGIGGTSLLTASSVVKNERKNEILEIFMENEGAEWIYGMIEPMIQDMVAEYAGEYEGLDTEGLLTVEDVKKIATEFYGKAVEGEIYTIDVTFIGDRIKPQLDGIIDAEIDKQIDAQADAEIEKYVDENLETIYDSLSEDVKTEIKAEVKPVVLEEGKKVFLEEVEKEFNAKIDEIVEEEVDKYIKENYPGVSSSVIAKEKEKYLAENKDRIIAEAKAETMAEAEKQYDEEAGPKFDAEADTYIRENIREIYAQIDEETKAELIARAKEEALPKFKEEYKAEHKQQYIDEYSAMIDEAVLSAQTEINATIASVYESEEYAEFEQLQAEYDVNIYDFDALNRIVTTAGYICFGAAGVVILILLLCYLFRPAGFFVSGIFVLIFGGVLKVASGSIIPMIQEIIRANVELPHGSIGEMITAALGWMMEGWNASAMIGIFAGAALVLLGVLVLIIRRNKAA